jgi:hypothetical protein
MVFNVHLFPIIKTHKYNPVLYRVCVIDVNITGIIDKYTIDYEIKRIFHIGEVCKVPGILDNNSPIIQR